MSTDLNVAGPANASTEDTPEARQYSRIHRWLSLTDTFLGIAFLVVLLATGWTRNLRDLGFRFGNDNYALALFFYVLLLTLVGKLVSIPLDVYGFKLEHRFNLSNQTTAAWVFDEVKGWLVGLALFSLLAELVYWIIRKSPEHWWLYSWAAFIALFVVFAQLAPVVLFPIFYKFVPLENEELRERLVRLSERAGTRVRGVYEWKLSEKSKKANAALTGLGNTRRIIVADTLLANYSHDEIEAVLAHELGHHVHGHIMKSIVLQLCVTFVGFWAADEVLRYATYQTHTFDLLSDFANLPLLALVSAALSLLLMPALNAYSRYNERQADRYCWKSVPSVEPFITAMDKLSVQNLSEKTPSRLVEVLFHSHPPVSKRIAAARVFAAQNTVAAH
ncbi:MAG: M48 family metallopeptidase [Acidobacteria bacterium]|nr:M48 family metallopeptidase [Acidobacteriota bacterium]MBV9436681.1 M48 family metallopeptidase [Acidobacteriota bacterium]